MSSETCSRDADNIETKTSDWRRYWQARFYELRCLTRRLISTGRIFSSDGGQEDETRARELENDFLALEYAQKIIDTASMGDFDIKLATGSNSGSLIGFARLGGLMPSGELLAEDDDITAFSGELREGSFRKNGVSKEHISFTRNLLTAIEYSKAKFNRVGWQPSEQKDADKITVDENEPPWYASDRQKVDHERTNAWCSLNDTERQFVSKPFRVIYGIVELSVDDTSTTPYNLKDTFHLDEILHKGYVPAHQPVRELGRIVVYCPADKITIVEEYLHNSGMNEAKVQPLEAFDLLAYQRDLLKKLDFVRKMWLKEAFDKYLDAFVQEVEIVGDETKKEFQAMGSYLVDKMNILLGGTNVISENTKQEIVNTLSDMLRKSVAPGVVDMRRFKISLGKIVDEYVSKIKSKK